MTEYVAHRRLFKQEARENSVDAMFSDSDEEEALPYTKRTLDEAGRMSDSSALRRLLAKTKAPM